MLYARQFLVLSLFVACSSLACTYNASHNYFAGRTGYPVLFARKCPLHGNARVTA